MTISLVDVDLEEIVLSTAEIKCARWRRESVPVWLREKGREALVCVSVAGDLQFGVWVSFAGYFWRCVRRGSTAALSLFAGCEPKALAVHLQNMDMMCETIEERASEPFRAED